MKTGKYCAEEIQDDAIICRFCNRSQIPTKKPFLKWIGILLYVIAGLYGLALSWNFLVVRFDVFTAVLLMLFMPIISIAAPWYYPFAHGLIAPLLIIYGGGILGSIAYNKSGYVQE